MTSDKIKYPIIMIVVLFVLFSILSLTHSQLKIDEKYYHIPALELVNEYGLYAVFDHNYSAANTPIPYFIASLTSKLTGIDTDLKFARAVNICVSIISFMLLVLYLLKKQYKNYWLLLIVFFHPYILKSSFTYYMSMYGLLFFILFLFFIEKTSKNNADALYAGLALSFGILTQQFYIALIPVFYILLWNENGRSINGKYIYKAFLFTLPMLLPLGLFIGWGGLTHQNFRVHAIGLHLTNLTGLLASLGFFFFPFILLTRQRIDIKSGSILFFVSLILVLFFSPLWQSGPAPGMISGITYHGLEIVRGFSSPLKLFLETLLVTFGLLLLKVLMHKKSRLSLEILIIILFIIGYCFNSYFSERHLIPVEFFLYLLVWEKVEWQEARFWLVYQFFIGSSYFYYLMEHNNYPK